VWSTEKIVKLLFYRKITPSAQGKKITIEEFTTKINAMNLEKL
jgi:hypothetical protein